MMQIDYSQLLEELREVARDAGREIMRIYESSIEVNFKDDGSPVTLADEAAGECHSREVERNYS
jgi:3'(2'), 5'-bisphosphate nucleotidase